VSFVLKHTFIHLPHIGRVTERRLWEHGVLSWQDVIDENVEYAKRFSHIKQMISRSVQKLNHQDARFFTDRMVSEQHWRIFPEFANELAYLDIETTGLRPVDDHITTISLYDGKNVWHYVHGKNLEQFSKDIKKYRVLVTYNGKCFDIPFIEREFGIKLHHAHLDLRYIMHSIGIKGGLKSCEHQLGLSRGELEGIDGYFAVLLWKDFLGGNKKALDTLLAYNIEDTINLEKLMYYAVEKKIMALPLKRSNLENMINGLKAINEKSVEIPYKPDHATINRIKQKYY
jgi:uncharacterized protein YprB with RNaseH-like and TPR domain